MAGDQASPPQRTGLSLYANLLDGSAPGTISSAPVSYNKAAESSTEQDEAAKKQQALAASLRFQPTKRPQLSAQKAKAKAIASKLAQHVSATVPAQPTETKLEPALEGPAAQSTGTKTTAADWIATLSEDEDVNAYYASTKQKRKKRKKNKETMEVQQDWDDIYDPTRPNVYDEYKRSEEKIREVREWKDLLYRHRISSRRSSGYDSDKSEARPLNKQFAPPPSTMSFAPPPNFDDDTRGTTSGDDNDTTYVPPPPPDPATVVNDASGEDAYLRRLRMSQPGVQQPTNHPPPAPPPPPPPPPPPSPPSVDPPVVPPGQISRAAVRYNLPSAPAEIPASEAELEAQLNQDSAMDDNDDGESSAQPRSSRPGQAGFAERLMMKYGWTKGSGLGASGSGITNALYAKVDKRKKKSDAEGGGFVTPASMGKIMGGQRSKESQAEEGKYGAMSEVIRLENMLRGIDVLSELSKTDAEGGLMQEIGEECGEKYGSVERVYIHTADDGEALVFVKFVSQLSALRAVNALEGRMFNGNQIKAQFWDRDKFEDEVYQ